jgi:toxin ParE1/3/4
MPSSTSSKKLLVSAPAKADLGQIGDYTERQWGAQQKRKYLNRIKDQFKALLQTPGLGAPRDDIAKGLRAHPAGRHLVFYRETKSELQIVRVPRESMDVEPLRVD